MRSPARGRRSSDANSDPRFTELAGTGIKGIRGVSKIFYPGRVCLKPPNTIKSV